MAGSPEDQLNELLRQDIHAETAQIAWSDLQFLFAAGKVIYVAHDLDLIETALQISSDNTSAVEAWMQQGKLAPVSDEQAKAWVESQARVWAVVIKPWVLVQDIEASHHEH